MVRYDWEYSIINQNGTDISIRQMKGESSGSKTQHSPDWGEMRNCTNHFPQNVVGIELGDR